MAKKKNSLKTVTVMSVATAGLFGIALHTVSNQKVSAANGPAIAQSQNPNQGQIAAPSQPPNQTQSKPNGAGHVDDAPVLLQPHMMYASPAAKPTAAEIKQGKFPAKKPVPEPLPTPVPHPTVTSAPHPTVTSVPHPTVTSTPHPPVTSAPHTAVTSVPHPTVTSAPHPAVTAVPHPAVTSVPHVQPSPVVRPAVSAAAPHTVVTTTTTVTTTTPAAAQMHVQTSVPPLRPPIAVPTAAHPTVPKTPAAAAKGTGTPPPAPRVNPHIRPTPAVVTVTTHTAAVTRPAQAAMPPLNQTPQPQHSTLPAQPSGVAPIAVLTQTAPKAGLAQIKLVEADQQHLFKPVAVLQTKDKACFLGVNCVWVAKSDLNTEHPESIVAERFDIVDKMIDGVPVQEFNNFVYYEADNALMILDKAGDLFEFQLEKRKFRVFRANKPFILGSPDPDFIDLCVSGSQVMVLDPERNEIWSVDGKTKKIRGLFKEVLPWRLKPGDISVADGICIAYDGAIYLLRRPGMVAKFLNPPANELSHHLVTPCKRVAGERASRLATAPGAPLIVIERENNRVLAYDKTTGVAKQFLFPKLADLRGAMPIADGFWIINGDTLCLRKYNQPDAWKLKPQGRKIDSRLDVLRYPIPGRVLPSHPGVYPGARRLYRYGVHEGTDYFDVPMNKTVHASAAGKIIRADANFKDLTEKQLDRIMSECLRDHRTSDYNEDLFRGCQVWIDHGGGLITKYAHLNKINPKLKVDQNVSRGDLIGYVGVSGTGQSLPGRAKYPHLHFEVWLDGHYVGYGFTPQETIGIYEDIFGRNPE